MFKFEFTLEELNLILGGLAEIPYRVSNPIINKLIEQYNSQLPKPE